MRSKPALKAEVFFSPAQADDLYFRGKNVVVVDVLRASTTIATALHNGAKEIIPIATIEGAVKVSGSLFGDVTLRGGERNGKVIKGFNLGNSPREYTEDAVRGKSIIFTTTNGSAAMVKVRYAKNTVVGGFMNITRVVGFLKELKEDFIVMCAGEENDFALEDAVCAGTILARVEKSRRRLDPNDAGKACVILHGKYGRNILSMLQETGHGRFLTGIGFGEDLKLCAGVDTVPVLPIMTDNVIRLQKSASPHEVAA